MNMESRSMEGQNLVGHL